MKKRVFISPVGTSIITNFVRNNKMGFNAYKYANLKESEYEQGVLNELNKIFKTIVNKAESWSVEEAKLSSAELNGLLSFDKQFGNDDSLFFIVTDTYQSKLAYRIVKKFLTSRFGITAQEVSLKNLTTKNKKEFLQGIKELLKWSDGTLPGYKTQGYSIYFNLTGGFKSLLGYLTPIGMFYADTIFYIFETGDLIEIPKLPIKINDETFSQFADKFLLMSVLMFLDESEVKDLPKTLLEEAGEGMYGLSVWGELSWNQVKHSILPENLVNLPGLEYSDKFKDDFKTKNTDIQKIQLQETLAKVSSLLNKNKGDTSVLKRDNGLSYENCKKKIDGKTVGHFRYNRAQRVSCIAEKGELLLLRNGFHDVCDK